MGDLKICRFRVTIENPYTGKPQFFAIPAIDRAQAASVVRKQYHPFSIRITGIKKITQYGSGLTKES